jgi:2-hydroxy-6-oxonona-2,4-dienedioate hydrolase
MERSSVLPVPLGTAGGVVNAPSIWAELMGCGLKENYYDVNGVRTRVLEAGSGHPLIMLHGTGGHAETYVRNIGPLSQHFRVMAVDMIGHGYTGRCEGDYTMDTFADHVHGLIDVIGADQVFLSGESLGGGVACWTALKYPRQVAALSLTTGILARPDAKGMKDLDDVQARTARLGENLNQETIRKRLEWLVHDPASMTEEMVQARLKVYSQPGMVDEMIKVMGTVFQMNRAAFGDVDYYDHTLAKLHCPVLVVWTDHNPGKSYAAVKPAIDAIPDKEFHMLEGAAHWPQWEKAAEVNELLISFLARVQGATRHP